MIKQILSQEEIMLLEKGHFSALPLHTCQINGDWQLTNKICLVLTRKLSSGNICAAFYSIDMYCVGIKHVGFIADLDPGDLFKNVWKIYKNTAYRLVDCDYNLAYQLIKAAKDYANGFGIAPDENFKYVKHMLDVEIPVLTNIQKIEFGKNGKPFLCVSADDDKVEYYLTQLDKYVGEGNYIYKDTLYMSESEDLSHYLDKWTIVEWNDFIDEFDLEDYVNDYPIMDYMFKKIFDGYEGSEGLKQKLDNFISTYAINFGHPEDSTFSNRPGELEALEALVMYESSAGRAESERMLNHTLGYIERWPDNIEFRNFQITLEASLGIGNATERIKQMMVDFPDYLPARINYARALTLTDKFNQARKVCDYKDTLDEICPSRNEFNEREFLPFTHFMAYGYTLDQKIYHAYLYVSMLTKVDPEIAEMGYDDQLMAYANGVAVALFLDCIESAKENTSKKTAMIELLTM